MRACWTLRERHRGQERRQATSSMRRASSANSSMERTSGLKLPLSYNRPEMHDLEEFEQRLKKERRTASTIAAHLLAVRRFSGFLETRGKSAEIDEAEPQDITAFADKLCAQGESVKGLLWSLHNYYRCSGNRRLHDHAMRLRLAAMEPERKGRSAPKLSGLEGGSARAVAALRSAGIETTSDLLRHAASMSDRRELARSLGVRCEDIEELTSFADLSRITDIKGRRCRMLLDAGIRSVAGLRTWDPNDLRQHVASVARDSGCRQPTATEARYWVQQAKNLPDVLIAG